MSGELPTGPSGSAVVPMVRHRGSSPATHFLFGMVCSRVAIEKRSRAISASRFFGGIRESALYAEWIRWKHIFSCSGRAGFAAKSVSKSGACARMTRRSLWDADHILPVAEGGGECDLENIRTLCLICHRRVTQEL